MHNIEFLMDIFIAAEGFIRDVLNDKSVVRKSLSGGAVEYRLPN
ncbi:hypothetical protein [Raoultella terrigena]|nr:hypothetical protein [Raoultella terrigena]